MRQIKWGVVIQGPIVTFGQGQNKCEGGYDATNDINSNINSFANLVSQIVVSTWENSGFIPADDGLKNVSVVESKSPSFFDPDNRKKQFISTYAGIRELTSRSEITHILKIRTDQVVPPKVINWLTDFFVSQNYALDFKQNSKIIFSEFIKSEKFYVGDFIFAASSHDLTNFICANLKIKNNIHPSIANDYYLKNLLINDRKNFRRVFLRFIPLIFQIARKDMEVINNYWEYLLCNKCSFLPKNIAEEIIWRGRAMKNLGYTHFCYYEDWVEIRKENKKIKLLTSKTKGYKLLIQNKSTIGSIKYEYSRYVKFRFKYIFPKTYMYLRDLKKRYGRP